MIKANTQLGKYRVKQPIGKGGMADVYLAKDTALGRDVAIKVLPPEMAQNKEWLARFNQEVLATANLFHPNIVTVYDVGHEQDIHFYAMEYLPSGDLKQRIEQGLTVHLALRYLRQIAEALEYAHRKGFIHRDIKPENILFDEDGHAKLTDLGIAKAIKDSQLVTNSRQSIGTPRYISPEQAQGESIDERSDLYSLGIVFYEMLTGEVPYDDEEPLNIALAHIKKPVPQLPPQLSMYQDFLTAMLAKEKADRFTSASELLEALELIEQDYEFHLEEFYQKRLQKRPDVFNFEGISQSLDETEPKPKLWLFVIIIAGLVSIGFWQKDRVMRWTEEAYQSLSTLTTSTKADADEPSGVIQIDSIPSGATVYLNGREVGTTPYLGQAVPAGRQRIKLTHPSFADHEQSIDVIADKVVSAQIELVEGVGDLLVQSQPAGAFIELDEKLLKTKTPHVVTGLKTGEHKLFLYKDHLAAQISVDVVNNKETPITVTLKEGFMAYYPDRWVPIKNLYQLAEQLMQTGNLSAPTGNNAEEVYHAILKADNVQQLAKKKLEAIGWQHWELAKQAANQRNVKLTERHLNHSRRLLKDKYLAAEASRILESAKK